MPLFQNDSLAADTSGNLAACPPIGLARVADLTFTVECTYRAEARRGLRVRIKASHDGICFDTEDPCAFEIPCAPAQRVSKRVPLDAKIVVENADARQDATSVSAWATLGSP